MSQQDKLFLKNKTNVLINFFIVLKIDLQRSCFFSLARDKCLAVTVTRSCWGLWDTSTGKLLAQLAEAPLGAIVTHAVITPSGDNVITAESGNVIIWDTPEKQVMNRMKRILKTSKLFSSFKRCLN